MNKIGGEKWRPGKILLIQCKDPFLGTDVKERSREKRVYYAVSFKNFFFDSL